MASIAEMIAQSGLQSSQTKPDLTGAAQAGAQIGAQLAQTIQNVQKQREQLEMQKQDLELKKDEALASSFETMGKIKSPTMRKIYAEKVLSNKLKMLGREDMFAPGVYEAIQKGDQESINRIVNGIKAVRDGHKTYAEFRASLQNEDDFITLESYEPEFIKAQEAQRDYQERLNVAKVSAGQRQGNFDVSQLQKIKDDFDSTVKPLREGITAADNAWQLLQTDTPIASEAVKTQLARLTGEKGPLTDADIARFGGSKDLLGRSEAFMTKLTTGKLTPETRAEYKTIISEFRNVLRAKVKDEESRQVMSAEGLGLDAARTRKVLAADSITKTTGSGWEDKLARTKAPYQTLSQEDKQKFLDGASKRLKISVDKIKAYMEGK